MTVIEGQGDGVTLGHWNLPAVALAGTAVSKDLVDQLRKHKVVYIGVENNAAGRKAALCQRCHLHIQARYVPDQLVFVRFAGMEKRGLT